MRDDARALLTRLRRDGIEVTVLDRYGLENYFPRHAFETVMKQGLGGHFPLDPRRPLSDQIRGHDKNINVDLARATILADLAETDLGAFLERVARLAGD